MHPISGLNPDAARPLAQAAGIQGAPQDRPPREQDQGRPLRPAADEYTPEQKEPPSGRYWLERDGDGRQVVFYDGPQQPAGGPARPEAGDAPASGGAQPQDAPAQPRQAEDAPDADAPQPGRAAEGPEEKRLPEDDQERCTVDTGRVDREIEALKKQKQELERQLKAETDETKARALRARVAQIEQELSQKDNDTYRRQHAEYSFS